MNIEFEKAKLDRMKLMVVTEVKRQPEPDYQKRLLAELSKIKHLNVYSCQARSALLSKHQNGDWASILPKIEHVLKLVYMEDISHCAVPGEYLVHVR